MLQMSNGVMQPVGLRLDGVANKLRTGTHLWDRNAERHSPVPNILIPLEDKPYPEREERGERVYRIDPLVVVVVCSREEEGMYGIPDSRQNRIHSLRRECRSKSGDAVQPGASRV